jgi:DNA-directed RNA polymerase specialized sigma24 family protein
MGERDTTGLDEQTYRRLLRVATMAAMKQLSTSAKDNVTDEAAAQAVWEYWLKVEAGEDIENDEAFVTRVAQRRAVDEQRRWKRNRHLRHGHEDPAGDRMLVPDEALGREPSLMPRSDDSWRRVLVDLLRTGGDTLDEKIGVAVFLDGEEPADVAERLGIAEKTVRNRMTTIRKSVVESIDGPPA